MLSKINLSSKNKKENQTRIRIMINSLSYNSKEFSESEEVVNYFKSKNIKINEIIDLNQELIFERDKSIKLYD